MRIRPVPVPLAGFPFLNKLTRHLTSARHQERILTESRRNAIRESSTAQPPVAPLAPPVPAVPKRRGNPNWYSNIRNADGEVNAGLTTKRRMQEEITAEEGVIGGILEEVKTVEKKIATHKAVAEKMMELYGQVAAEGNIDVEYVSGEIDKEKATITENEKTLVVLQKDVREKQVKVQNWKELMERV
ncbi:Structural maintenance of chromosomes protein 6 [Orchesella cincta]|uniref:Structural maintenance of chromosomes protein 6 n=1 Tax=Orchesella cincta TaxID=48709 RepID=A0A1D2MZN0_ORCCI|nr:Structural maintenance of chromosomes protein 6 [Orchesella cincta]